VRISYCDLYPEQFQELVWSVCVHLLGQATQKFSSGKDGGRDAKFYGTAACMPSKDTPHTGHFVVQAKHSENPIAKLSDKDFSGSAPSSVVSTELARVRRLVTKGQLDHYIIFTNRRAGGETCAGIEDRLIRETGVKTATVYGIEAIDGFLKQFPKAIRLANIDPWDRPLRVIPDQLADVIVALRSHISSSRSARTAPRFNRVAFEKKNECNDLSPEFAETIRRDFFQQFGAIRTFLARPANRGLREKYEDAAIDFNAEIIERRRKRAPMDALLNDLVHRLKFRDGDLSRNPRLTRAVVYFMYWSCDVGQTC
jgi:hypothetical protein